MRPVITFVLQDLLVGGAQRHTVSLCDSLQNEMDTSLLVHARGVADGIVPERLRCRVTVLQERGLLNPLKWIKIARAIASNRPSLVVTINQIATILAMFGKICGVIKCPVISIFHTTDIRDRAGWVRTIPYIVMVWFSNAIVYISKNQMEKWVPRMLVSRRVEVIRNGIDLSDIPFVDENARRSAKERLNFSPSDFVIGSLAVFRKEKNHNQLIEALAALRRLGIPAKVLLVGDGPMRKEIQAKVEELGMVDHVHFAGEQREVHPYIAAMDVGVLTSVAVETLSLAALEIMAMGVPMVMSDIGGASEIITEGREGYLFPAGDTPQLVEKLRRCSTADHARLLGHNAALKVRNEFDHRMMCEAYRKLFQELIAES